ncbi:MAG: hypothetical protein M0Z25_00665 [Nitrospiraceae bacterium]|nr:hypothetical protein [Nitrospiraceae bacterium]
MYRSPLFHPDARDDTPMESLSITPAIALMRPALLPFLLVLVLLMVLRLLPERWRLTALLPDLVVLAGILFLFGLFDPASIRHFFNPNRPMDWIPLLATFTFALRTILPRTASLLSQAGILLVSLTILTLPLLRQVSLEKGMTSLLLTFAPWIGIRALYPADARRGIDATYLLPPFFTAGAFSFISPLSGSLLLGQLAGGLAALFGAMLLSSWKGGVRVSAIESGWVMGALLVIGLDYVDISLKVILCLAGALMLGAVVGRLSNRIWGLGGGRKAALVSGFAGLPLVAAVVVALNDLKNQGGGY